MISLCSAVEEARAGAVSRIDLCAIVKRVRAIDTANAFNQRLYKLDGDKKLDLVNELELSREEDAPMSVTAHKDVRVARHIRITTY